MTDKEMYNKIKFLSSDDEQLGCYIEGHYDFEQFKRVATEYIKKECEFINIIDCEARLGYYKVIPREESSVFYFSKDKMRGSKPIMEMCI